MKLISCHIENFGKLSDFDMDFNEGLNVLKEDNGYGKSTLTAFLKAMFFGFANEKSRDELNNERKRYAPWQGGVFGGSVTFEASGKKYILRRIWGKKEAEDEFELREKETGIESSDFGINIGEELFQINGESFARTSFIAQSDCRTVSTNDINAKIGNLSAVEDDIRNFDAADEMLKNRLNNMNPGRKTGSVNKLKRDIAELEQVVRSADFENPMNNIRGLRDEKKSRLNMLKEEQLKLQEEQKKQAQLAALKEKHDRYMMVCEEEQNRKKAYDEVQASFGGHIPAEKDIDLSEQNLNELNILQQKIDDNRLDDDEQRMYELYAEEFYDGIPSDDELSDMLILCGKINEQAERRAELEKKHDEIIESRPADSGKKGIILLALAGAFLAAFVISFIMVSRTMWYIPAISGAIALILAAVGAGTLIKDNRNSVKYDVSEIDDRIEKCNQTISDMNSGLIQFVSGIGENYKPDAESVKRIRNHAACYRALIAKKENATDEGMLKRISELQKQIADFSDVYNRSMPVNGYVFAELRKKLERLEHAKKEYGNAVEQREYFENNNDMDAVRSYYPSEKNNPEELNARLTQITEDIEEAGRVITDYNNQINVLSEKLDDISEKKDEIERLKEELVKQTRDYRISGLAREYLDKAKVSFITQYTAPVLAGFKKYYFMLTGMSGDEYELDANMALTYTEKGLSRNTETLSAGFRDVSGICFRMALVDAMYQDEKPFLIFDDPFVNLDSSKKKLSEEFLGKVSKEYQIIYMTCN